MFSQIAIIGTTASGKSDFALDVAHKTDSIILSLDSMCLYKDINIASAKPSPSELEKVRHFGINLVNADEDFCVGDFIKEYEKAKRYALQKEQNLIITGGSSFYLKAMLEGLSPKIEPKKIDISNDKIWDLILKHDYEFALKFSKNDEFRLHKWYQIYSQTAQIPSIWLQNTKQTPTIENIQIYELVWDKEELRDRIYVRTKNMIKNGLIEEALGLFREYGYTPKALNSIGLKECGEFFKEINLFDEDGNLLDSSLLDSIDISSPNEPNIAKLIDLISIHTAQLAKRQRTFNAHQFKHKIAINGKNPKLSDLKI